MPLVPMRILLDHAAEDDYGLAAFNVNNMEQIQAVMSAAEETESPVIVQASRGARTYMNDNYLRHLMLAACERHPTIPIAVHFDHGTYETCMSAIDSGFTSVIIDGSLEDDGKIPASFEYNVKVTRQVVEAAHAKGVTVEGKLGSIGGIEDGHGAGLSDEESLRSVTDPEQAGELCTRSGVDALAVDIVISTHGAYKFRRESSATVLAIDTLKEIHNRIPDVPLVMHRSHEIPIEDIQLAIKHGVRKVTVHTDHHLAMANAIRRVLTEHPGEFDPRKLLGPAREAMKQECKERMIAFGQAGNANKIKPVTCEEMVTFYASKNR